MLRWTTAGESHGQALVALLEGLPAGVRVERAEVEAALRRRRGGHGRGSRMSFEADELTFLTGMRHGLTLASPIAVRIGNTEWPKWESVMSPEPVEAAALAVDAGTGDVREQARNRPLTRPRPGHADLVGMLKYGFDEARPVLERASARETASRVVLGSLAQAFLRQVGGIEVVAHTVSIGTVGIADAAADAPRVEDLPTEADRARIDADPVRSHRPELSAAMVAEIDAAKADGDTLGGVVEVVAWNLPPGLGSYVQGDQRLDARLAGALMGIQAIKGVELGEGFRTAARRGSVAHDEIARDDAGLLRRATTRAGGIEGGMSTGEPLRVRAAMKPISTVPRALRTIDTATGDATTASHQRSDICAVPAAGVVAEAMVALVLAQALLEKVGGDSLEECRRNLRAYLDAVPEHLRGWAEGPGDGADAADGAGA